jgi:hypothetical protein
MVIRSGQTSVLADEALNRANSDLAVYARRRFPDRFKDTAEPVLIKIAEEVRTRAAAEGFDREDHVATFLDLIGMYGSDFPRRTSIPGLRSIPASLRWMWAATRVSTPTRGSISR